MELASLFVAALATWQIVEIWHHSSLMATWRAKTQLWENKVGEMLNCPFCLSVWVGFVTAAIAFLPLPAVTFDDLGNSLFGWLLLICGGAGCGLMLMMLLGAYEHYLLSGDRKAVKALWLFGGGIAGVVGLTVVVAAFVLPAGTMPGVWCTLLGVLKVLTLGFAVARLANLGNDLTHKWCRTPRDKPPEDAAAEKPMVLNITLNQQPSSKTTFEKERKADEQRPPDAAGDARDDGSPADDVR